MDSGVVIAISVFAALVLVAVIAAVVVVSAVSSSEGRGNKDED